MTDIPRHGSGREGDRRSNPAPRPKLVRQAYAHYRRTFGRAVAVVYTGGTVAHILKLVFDFGWEYMPFWVDWGLMALGTYGGAGLIMFAGQVAWRGAWERVVHWLIVAHLLASVVTHAWTVSVGSHEFFTRFPYGYSYVAVAYFGLFAWRSWTTTLLPVANELEHKR